MIRNDRQFRIVKARAERLQRLVGELDKPDSTRDVRRVDLELRAVRGELSRLTGELEEYEALQTGKGEIGEARSFEDLPRLLIRARIARGLTQAQLAERLSLKEQQIQRYEATDYESASLARLREIAQALDVRFDDFEPAAVRPSGRPSTRSRGRGSTGSIEWLEVLDISLALKNCHIDLLGDWYRDPWGWPEMDWVVGRRPDLVAARLNSSSTRHVAKIDVAKENFSVRPAIIMDPLDRLIYQALVDRLSFEFIGNLKGWAFGWRLPVKDPSRGRYVSNSKQWEWYRSRLNFLSGWYQVGLMTDIVSYFASIPIPRIQEEITRRGRDTRLTQRLNDLLEGWSQVAGRSGLPQRSMASAVLANMYLAPADDVIHQFAPEARSAWTMGRNAATRWMDDIWMFGRDAGDLRKAQVAMQEVLSQLGLDMNFGKTDVLEGDELISRARELEHSAVDEDLAQATPTGVPLNELIEKQLTKPEHASRTSLRFITTRLREHELFDRVPDFAENADRMPHGADYLSRLFRDSRFWMELQEWFIDYWKSPWAAIDWSVAQFGTMFPSEARVENKIKTHLGEALTTGTSLSLTPFASQRLAAWDPDTARGVFREAARRADHPFERRVLALAALNAGDERAFIRSLLTEFEETTLTLSMLEDSNFRPPRIKRDYEGS